MLLLYTVVSLALLTASPEATARCYLDNRGDDARAECIKRAEEKEQGIKAAAIMADAGESAEKALVAPQNADREEPWQRAERRRRELSEAAQARLKALEIDEAEAEALRQKKCGRDYQRVRVGMAWKRVAECAGPFDLIAENGPAQVWEAEYGVVRVERGRVTRWIAK